MRIHLTIFFIFLYSLAWCQEVELQQSTEPDIQLEINIPLDSLQKKITSPFDSAANLVNSRYDSLENLANVPLDSLQSLKNNLQSQVDSINHSIDSLYQNIIGKPIDEVKEQQAKLKQKADSIQNEINGITKKNFTGERDVNFDITDNLKLDEIEQLNKLNDIIEPIEPLKELNLTEIELPESDILNNANIQEVGSISESVSEETLVKILENELTDLDEIQHLQEQTANLSRADQFKNQALQEVELTQEDIIKRNIMVRRVRQAREAFAKNAEKVKEAQGKIEEYQDSLQRAKKRISFRKEPLHWSKKLFVGLTWQLEKQEKFSLDLSPQLYYKLFKSYSFGFGGSYRIGAEDDFSEFYGNEQVYGWKAFNQLHVKKGFFLRIEYERLRTSVPTTPMASETYRTWVDGLYGAIVKDYDISKKVKGNIQVLYNFIYEQNHTPFAKKAMVRVGINFNPIKVKKSD